MAIGTGTALALGAGASLLGGVLGNKASDSGRQTLCNSQPLHAGGRKPAPV
jgi:hypothetical protein